MSLDAPAPRGLRLHSKPVFLRFEDFDGGVRHITEKKPVARPKITDSFFFITRFKIQVQLSQVMIGLGVCQNGWFSIQDSLISSRENVIFNKQKHDAPRATL